MKVTIRDSAILAAVDPLDLVAYLRTHGWRRAKTFPDRYETWVRDAKPQELEIMVPISKKFRDYWECIGKALRNLEIFEERSQLQILQDVTAVNYDVIRFRVEGRNNNLPLDDAFLFLKNSRDLLLASACATVEPALIFSTPLPDVAVQFLHKAEWLQSPQNDAALTFRSPVTPLVEAAGSGSEQPEPEPFERLVVRTLQGALTACVATAQRAATTSVVLALEEIVNAGVSANFCSALVNLQSAIAASALEVEVSWASGRPTIDGKTKEQILIRRDLLPWLEQLDFMLARAAVERIERLAGQQARAGESWWEATSGPGVDLMAGRRPLRVAGQR